MPMSIERRAFPGGSVTVLAMKTSVLFVDDEPRVLDGLRRMLRSLRREWEMAFANSGQEALEIMARRPYDVIVSDMRMPGMDGAQLLDEVMRHHPDTIRIVLSGQSDQEQILQSMRPTHQYLTKPCSAETLQGTIRRAMKLRALLTDDKARALVGSTGSVPSLPAFYLELMEELDSSDPSIRDIVAIVSRDAAMTAKVLQVANSQPCSAVAASPAPSRLSSGWA